MPTVDDCMKCTKPCPQANLAHDNAVGRMNATNELLSYVRKVEQGRLVEVVRCGTCKYCTNHMDTPHCIRWPAQPEVAPDGFCSYGERKDGEL